MLKTLMMLIKKVNNRSAVFFIIGIFKDKGFKFQLNVCNGFHDVLMSTKLSDIDILNIQTNILAKVRP